MVSYALMQLCYVHCDVIVDEPATSSVPTASSVKVPVQEPSVSSLVSGTGTNTVQPTGGLIDLDNPQTFDIGQGRQRVTKADFFSSGSGIKKNLAKPDDPFSLLDPMWKQ